MKKNRVIAVLLTVCMLAAFLPAGGALAEKTAARDALSDLTALSEAYHNLRAQKSAPSSAPSKNRRAAPSTADGDEDPCRLIVRASQQPQSERAVASLQLAADFWILQYSSEDAMRQDAAALADCAGVTSVLPERRYIASQDYLSWGYAAEYIDANNYNGWLAGQSGTLPQVVVAVIDSGVKYDHEFLAGRVLTDRDHDFVNDDDDAMDDAYHGTHVAGTVVDGTLPNVKILPVKVLDSGGSGSDTEITLGIRYAVEQHVDVINLSLGGSGDSELMAAAIDEATAAGIVVCVAAGNENDDASGYFPANVPSAVTVGAIDEFYERASFSNYGDAVDIAAPGVNVYSAVPREASGDGMQDYEYLSGTSMATPHVAAAAAAVKSYNRTLNAAEVLDMLRSAAIPLDTDEPLGCGALCLRDLASPDASAFLLGGTSKKMYPGQEARLPLKNETGLAAVWTSSDPAVVSVQDGLLTAHRTGTAQITVQAGDRSRRCAVTVTPLVFTMDEADIDTYVGLPQLMPFTLSHNVPVEWTVTGGGGAQISEKGMLMPTAAGDATVTATVAAGTVSAQTHTIRLKVRTIGDWYTGPGQSSYVLRSARDLYELSVLLLTKDADELFTIHGDVSIDPTVGALDMSEFTDFIPICHMFTIEGRTYGGYFEGSFDGGNVPIVGLTIGKMRPGYEKSPYLSGVGLFSGLGRGVAVRNVRLVDADISGGVFTGGIAGSGGGNIENCYVSGRISGNGFKVGGIAGTISRAVVRNCENAAQISIPYESWSTNAGGIAGSATYDSKVINCLNRGKIDARASGGIVAGATDDGNMYTPIYSDSARPVREDQGACIVNCVNVGEVTSAIANNSEGVVITNCFWLSSASRFGVRSLQAEPERPAAANEPQIYTFDSALTAEIDGRTVAIVDALDLGASQCNEGKTEDLCCMWEVRDGLPALRRGVYRTGRSLIWFRDPELMLQTGKTKYPVLCRTNEDAAVVYISSAPDLISVAADGGVTAHDEGEAVITAVSADGCEATLRVRSIRVSDWYDADAENLTIHSGAELRELANVANVGLDDFTGKTVTLANDISLAAYPNWTPIGDELQDAGFGGTFDGAGHKIAGLTYTDAPRNNFGLFGHVTAGGVQNLRLTDVLILQPKEFTVGCVCVELAEDAVVRNCAVFGELRGDPYRTAVRPYASMDQYWYTLKYSGGIVSRNEGNVLNCLCALTATPVQNYGGIVGTNVGDVRKCVHAGVIRTDYDSAGICYWNTRLADLESCVNSGTLTFRNADHDDAFDLAGIVLEPNGYIINCLNLGDIILMPDKGGAAGIVGVDSGTYACYANDCVNHGALIGGKTTAAIGDAGSKHMRYDYWLTGSAQTGLRRERQAGSVENVGPYDDGLLLSDGRSLIDVLNGRLEEMWWYEEFYPTWYEDPEGRPNLDFGCDHPESVTVTQAFTTCISAGREARICAVCGTTMEVVAEHPALGHDFILDYERAPTCYAEGETVEYCTRCYLQRSETRPKVDHRDGDGNGFCDFCGTDLREPAPQTPEEDRCPYCGKVHTGPFAFIIRFFHNIMYFFRKLFRR